MARQRHINIGDFADARLAAVSLQARYLLLGLRTLADDRGALPLERDIIRRKLPMCGGQGTITAAIVALQKADLLKGYTIDGRNYLAIRDFAAQGTIPRPGWRYPMPEELFAFVGLSQAAAARIPQREIGRKPGPKDDFHEWLHARGRGSHYGHGRVEGIKYLTRSKKLARDNHGEIPAAPKPRPQRVGRPINASAPVVNGLPAAPALGMISGSGFRPPAPGLGPARIPPVLTVVPKVAAPPVATGTVPGDGSRRYEWEGAIVKLNRTDFERWRLEYSAIPDFKAALRACDDWLSSELSERGPKRRLNWFVAAKAYLAKRQQEWAARKQQRAASPHPYSVRTLLPGRGPGPG